MAAAVVPATAFAAPGPLAAKATKRCDTKLRKHDGTDVFALSLDLQRTAKASGLPACSVRLAAT